MIEFTPGPIDSSDVTAETHEQAMACLSCGLAGLTPPDHFPQERGVWDRPCPNCGEHTVWIAAPIPKSKA